MNVAALELRRRPERFATAVGILALLATLLMLLGGLLDGLLNGATGAVAAQRGDVIVYSSTAEQSFLRSRITPEQAAEVAAVDGVAEVGGLGVAQLGARVPGNDDRDLADVALFGYEIAPEGVPAPPAAGEAYADRSLESSGITDGMTIQVGPARTPIKVVGWVDDLAYSGQGSLWASPDTWRGCGERQPARCRVGTRRVPGAGGPCRRRYVGRGAGRPDRPRHRRGHRLAQPGRRGGGHPRCGAAALHLQPDHRGHGGDRRGGRGPVLRPPHRGAHRPLRRAQGHRCHLGTVVPRAWSCRRWWSPASRR